MTVTGLGHRLWRLSSFPKMARSLFKRFVQNMDEHGDDKVDCTDETTTRQVENVSTEALDTREFDSINDFPPKYVSTPNAPRSGQSQTHTLTAGTGDGTVSDTLIASRGNQVAKLIDKINHMETVIEDLKRAVILLVDGVSQQKSYAQVANRSTPGSNAQGREASFTAELSTQTKTPENVRPPSPKSLLAM